MTLTEVNADVDTSMLVPESAVLAERLIRWLATGVRPEGLFSPRTVRRPDPAAVAGPGQRTRRELSTSRGRPPDVGRVAQAWTDAARLPAPVRGALGRPTASSGTAGRSIHGVVAEDRISECSCTARGDWDEAVQHRHAHEVHLLRP